MRLNRKAQSTLEYAVLIAVVVGALVAIRYYMGRGVQGKLRESTDQIGEQFSMNHTTVNKTTNQTGPISTREETGTAWAGGRGSKVEYTATADVKQNTTENVTANLSEETVF